MFSSSTWSSSAFETVSVDALVPSPSSQSVVAHMADNSLTISSAVWWPSYNFSIAAVISSLQWRYLARWLYAYCFTAYTHEGLNLLYSSFCWTVCRLIWDLSCLLLARARQKWRAALPKRFPSLYVSSTFFDWISSGSLFTYGQQSRLWRLEKAICHAVC